MSQRKKDGFPIKDKRFSSARTDPRFRRVPRRVNKIKIDSRFAGMFEEDRFQLNYTSDKRGRSINSSASEDLRKFYHLDDSDRGVTVSAAELVCRSRGEIHVESSSSDSETDEEDTTFGHGGVNEGLIHGWAELDAAAETTDISTSRLAVCNMDWDRVTAYDLLLLFSSLAPDQGRVLSVRIFPSEYGSARIRAEDAEGPGELFAGESEVDNDVVQTEKLRKYQLNRLLYYYAIVETDSASTSDHLYQLCNGTEYELSGTSLDIRVVPDHIQFEDTAPTSVATPDTLPPDYTPSSFRNSALQHTKVELTWDETDPVRRKILTQNFSKAEFRELDFQAYLASGSESDGESDGEGRGESEERTISKFRSLLSELESRESDQRREEADLEITWEPGKLAPLEEAISKKTGKGEPDLTPWEEYVRKRKEKKKIKRNKSRKQEGGSEEEDDTKYESLFTELGGKKKKPRPSKSVPLTESEEKEREELRLLVASDSDNEGKDKKHFNMNEIWKNSKLSEKKKRKLARKGKLIQEDDFKLDLNDSRFGRLLDSPNYAPDPSDPQFHQRRDLNEIIEERKRRREADISQGISSNKMKKNRTDQRDGMLSGEQMEMSALVRKLKQKSDILKSRKVNKLKI